MIIKDGEVLSDMETWFELAGPKSAVQWKDERSAKESARAWLNSLPHPPSELSETLVSHPHFSDLGEWTAEPEAAARFDSFRGQPSNLDVLVLADDGQGRFVVAVEAKADEPFGGTVGETLERAMKRRASNPRSGGVARIERLALGLFGVESRHLEPLLPLRYQLLTATAAALAEAERRQATRAVVLVHEFVTALTRDERHDANAGDLDRFVSTLSNSAIKLRDRELTGPISVPGTPIVRESTPLYFGKATVNRR